MEMDTFFEHLYELFHVTDEQPDVDSKFFNATKQKTKKNIII